MKYLFIDEDGGLTQSDNIPPEVIQACDDGIWDIVDMEGSEQYTGDGKWATIPEIKPNDNILPDTY